MNVEKSSRVNAQSESELQRLRDFYEKGPDMFVSLDVRNQIIQSCNQTAVRKLCYDRKDQLIGQHFLFLYCPDFHDCIQMLFDQFCREGKIVNEQVQVRRQDGVAISALLSATAMRDELGVVVGSLSVLRKIGEPEKHEMASVESIARTKEKLVDEFTSIKKHLNCLAGDERSVFDGIVQGRLNKQIARKLDLSERTIERMRGRLVNKLNIKSTANLIAMASRFEILQQLFADFEHNEK